jgi:hypothetical protein
MILSKRKIGNILNIFTIPYKPTLNKYESEKEDMINFENTYNSNLYNQNKNKYSTTTYYKNQNYNTSKKFPSQNQYASKTYNIHKRVIPSYTMFYPLRNEIIMRNPNEIINSGVLKSSVMQVSPEEEGNQNQFVQQSIYQNLDTNLELKKNDEFNQISNSIQQKMDVGQGEIVEDNAPQTISNVIPNLSESQNLNNMEGEAENTQNNGGGEAQEKVEEEKPQEVEPTPEVVEKKYKIKTNENNVISLPENYSTDDNDEFVAVQTINEDLSSWKKYTEKDEMKIYFKPYPVKDEKGNDAMSVIGYVEATLNFPASKVIEKVNDFNFRKEIDSVYEKGKLLSEKMSDNNIKIMEIYLFMKMPFIFSDRDFVVQKKCWLDYNGQKDHALFYIHSIEHPEYPAKDKPVRGTYENRSGYIKPLGPNQSQINVCTAMDIKMSLGVDTMSKNGAEMQEKWIKKLREGLAKN